MLLWTAHIIATLSVHLGISSLSLFKTTEAIEAKIRKTQCTKGKPALSIHCIVYYFTQALLACCLDISSVHLMRAVSLDKHWHGWEPVSIQSQAINENLNLVCSMFLLLSSHVTSWLCITNRVYKKSYHCPLAQGSCELLVGSPSCQGFLASHRSVMDAVQLNLFQHWTWTWREPLGPSLMERIAMLWKQRILYLYSHSKKK